MRLTNGNRFQKRLPWYLPRERGGGWTRPKSEFCVRRHHPVCVVISSALFWPPRVQSSPFCTDGANCCVRCFDVFDASAGGRGRRFPTPEEGSGKKKVNTIFFVVLFLFVVRKFRFASIAIYAYEQLPCCCAAIKWHVLVCISRRPRGGSMLTVCRSPYPFNPWHQHFGARVRNRKIGHSFSLRLKKARMYV